MHSGSCLEGVKVKSNVIRGVLLHLRLSSHLLYLRQVDPAAYWAIPWEGVCILYKLPSILFAGLLAYQASGIVACAHQLLEVSIHLIEEGLHEIVLAFGTSCGTWALGDIFDARKLLLMLLHAQLLNLKLILWDAALLWIMCCFRRLQIVDVVDVTEWLLLHLDWVHYGLCNDCLVLLWLRFNVKAFSLG